MRRWLSSLSCLFVITVNLLVSSVCVCVCFVWMILGFDGVFEVGVCDHGFMCMGKSLCVCVCDFEFGWGFDVVKGFRNWVLLIC